MKSLSTVKRGINYWVEETDAITGEKFPHHHSVSNFSDRFYELFFAFNNVAVDAALKAGISLDDVYDEFYTLGFRLSQQLDGPIRERTEGQYNRIQETMQIRIVDALKDACLEATRKDLDSIIADEAMDGIPEADKERITQMVGGLRGVHVPSVSTFGREDSVSFEKKVRYYMIFDRENNSSWGYLYHNPVLAGNLTRIPLEARADYLELSKWGLLHEGTTLDTAFETTYDQVEWMEFVSGLKNGEITSLFKVSLMEARRHYEFDKNMHARIDEMKAGRAHPRDIGSAIQEETEKRNSMDLGNYNSFTCEDKTKILHR